MQSYSIPENPVLIADIGGTNARFAIADSEQPYFHLAQTFQCADFDAIESAIDAYLLAHAIEHIAGLCFAVAGPIIDGSVRFTNNHWQISSAELQQRYGVSQVKLLNDFAAIAYSLPKLRSTDLYNIGGDWPTVAGENYTIAVVGPGSGLGIAGLCSRDGHTYPIITEGGHAGFAPENELQAQVAIYLQTKFGRVSRERLLSGPGLMNIHEALCEIHDRENPVLSASDIANAGTAGTYEICTLTMDLYFEVLGQAAGDIALTLGANDGIFIGGGITQRYPDHLQASKFRHGFENKGRHSDLMRRIPTWLIKRKNPGLVGASVYALGLF
ncbi:MAG: glucokinase [Gammaproteobacteria bacterium]|nr:glucokinase [Gammaproteobacteria bacterium]